MWQSPYSAVCTTSMGDMRIVEHNQITKAQTLWPQHPPLRKGNTTAMNLSNAIAVSVNMEAAMATVKQ